MKKVAVFGNAGGGKSTLAWRLSGLTGLPLHVVDKMQFRAGGAEVPHEEFLSAHAELLGHDEWIIDGFGTEATAWERFAVADTLIHVDLPLAVHHWWVTKRLLKGLFADPLGWPERSPLWSSSMASYSVLWPCHRYVTPKYRQLVADAAGTKRVHHLRSPAEMRAFLVSIQKDQRR
jgi:adenylate kinase family enzyme